MKKILHSFMIWMVILFMSGCGVGNDDAENLQTKSNLITTKETENEATVREEMISQGLTKEEKNESRTAKTKEESKTTDKEGQNVSYPLMVTDQIGREVIIEKEPQTIVSGYYITTSLLIALEQDEKLVGVENDADKRPLYEKASPQILTLPGMGTVKEFDLEKCALLNPDLVILPFKLKDMAESLEQLGITVIFVKPENQQLLVECIELLGRATHTEKRAEKLVSVINEKEEEVKNLLQETEKPTVYISGNSEFLTTAGSQMYQHSLISNAGGVNVAQEITDSYWTQVSYEQLLAWNPEYIILAANAKFTADSVLKDENLQECRAVKEGKVYQIPNDIESWDSPVPGSVLGSLWLACVLHPQDYTESMYEKAVDEFYETFYDFTP